MMFSAGYALVAPATEASCSVLAWLLLLGLQLTFAPLFAKTWRIYRIFGRKKLSVVQISNRRLLLIVAAILTVQVVLLAVWQGLGSLSANSTIQTSSSGATSSGGTGTLTIHEYVQCGVDEGQAKSGFIVVCVETGLLFVFGALMAFTTRRVTSTFNESSGISLSIYNTCFTVGIITPIILVIQATGDVLTLLLTFALLWIAYFTAGILFVPKLMKIYHPAEGAADGNRSVVQSSSSGYAFLSLAALSTVSALQSYVMALEKHLVQAQGKLNAMKKGRSGGSIGGASMLAQDSPVLGAVNGEKSLNGRVSTVGLSSRLIANGRDDKATPQRSSTPVRSLPNRQSVSDLKMTGGSVSPDSHTQNGWTAQQQATGS